MKTKQEDILKTIINYCIKTDVEQFEYETKDMKLSIHQKLPPAPVSEPQPQIEIIETPTTTKNKEECELISSKMNGLFYNRRDSSQPPFCQVGDKVTAGDTIALIEVMKCFIEVNIDFSGVIEEVLVENETMVEHGQALFRIRRLTDD